MTKAPNRPTSLRPLGVKEPARVRDFDGTGAPKITTILTLVVMAALFALPTIAEAAQTRELLRTFGAAASTVADPAPLSNPQGMAIDQSSGDVYVADTANNRIEEFEANGTFLRAFGANVGGLGTNVCGGLVACEPGTQGSGPGQFTTARFVAVDNDPSSASFHDVYVGDTGDNLVSKFTSEGVLVASWGNNGSGGAANGQLNGSASAAGSFGELGGVAVDASGRLLVLATLEGRGTVLEFAETAAFLGELPLKTEYGITPNGLAVDAAGDLFTLGYGSLYKFDSAGKELGEVNQNNGFPGQAVEAMTVDPASADVYAVRQDKTIDHYAFNSGGEVIEPGGGSCNPALGYGCPPTDLVTVGFTGTGIAVSSATGDTYLSNPAEGKVFQFTSLVTIPDVKTELPTEGAPRSVTLHGSVNPKEIALKECEFEYVEAAKYKASAASPYAEGDVAECEPKADKIGMVNEEVKVKAKIAGLQPGVTYDYRLIATNENNESNPSVGGNISFETFPLPSIDSATVSDLTATSATLNASIKPQFSETHYHFEYDTRPYEPGEAAHGHATEERSIVPGTSDVSVSAPIAELHASEHAYYWRVVASNESGTTTSVQHIFVYDASGSGLPDGRAYEMVTPDHKNGALIGDVAFLATLFPEVAADGQRVMAPAIQCFGEVQSCNVSRGNAIGSMYEFARTPGGWVAASLAPPVSEFPDVAPWSYDADTGAALFSMSTPPLGEDDFYLRQPGGSVSDIGPNTPPEGGARGPVGGGAGGSIDVETADFSHVVWQTPARWSFDKGSPSGNQAYEYAGIGNAQPFLVGVTGGEASHDLISACLTRIRRLPGIISSDGRTVFFTADECAEDGLGANSEANVPADALYARVDGESADAHTVALSRFRSPGEECPAGEGAGERACRERTSPSECGAGHAVQEVSCREALVKDVGPPAAPKFLGASQDGSKALFTSTQQLTDTASQDPNRADSASSRCSETVGVGGCNLYQYDFANPAGQQLVDVSAGDSSGGGPRVQGVMAASPDGSHVYFIARGVLTTAANEQGQHAQDGANNLYLFEREGAAGRTVFIATLPETDKEEWANAPGSLANVTPDGRFLVFVSQGNLTADDTSVSGARQVFRYDAQTGRLNRVSIGDEGFNDDGNRSGATPCGHFQAYECSENAKIVPPSGYGRVDPSMSDDGSRVFFESPVALAPHALEDVPIGAVKSEGQPEYAQNIYEWEREGVGSCPVGRSAGCVFLISDGRDTSVNIGGGDLCTAVAGLSAACLLGTDTEGKNVFFVTADQLVAGDTNTEVDYYDARICEPETGNPCIPEPPEALPPCLGESCHGIPPARSPVTAGPTATFDGAGNLASPRSSKVIKKTVKCKRDFVEKKVKKKETCVKKKSKKRAKRASRNRRPNR